MFLFVQNWEDCRSVVIALLFRCICCSSYETIYVINDADWSEYYTVDGVDKAVIYKPDVVLSRPVDNTAIGYMRFDSDGHFRFYNDSMEPVDLLADVLQECDYPSICGDYGLCSNGQCSCPAAFARELVSDG
ncbi:hypothetical protein Q3G72_002108 [Acer saccharum]|nr:hypothetical protein Q3G72_002108 [Acer saccharum]